MTRHPRDVADLYLAPVVLALDARLDELGALDTEELAERVALDADSPDWSLEMRQSGLLRTVEHMIDLHGWTLSWHPRGLRMVHETSSLVLGVPSVFASYLEGRVATKR
jgi:hypothetical protein